MNLTDRTTPPTRSTEISPGELERVAVSPGQMSVSLALRSQSALAYCTDVDADDDGLPIIVRRWPSLSTGEELLWSVLAWVNGATDVPSRDELEVRLDAGNYAAAVAALESA